MFFKNCQCEKLNFEKGIEVSDELNEFKVKLPNSNWHPVTNFDENLGSNINGGDTNNGFLKVVSVNQIKTMDFNLDLEIEKLRKDFNVKEDGFVNLRGQKSYWSYQVLDTTSMMHTINTTYIDNNKLYTISLNVYTDKSPKQKLCQLEEFINTFDLSEVKE